MVTLPTKAVALTNHFNDNTDEFSIPLDISDILFICKEYHKLGWQIQNQIETILEIGIDESIKNGFVKPESLSHIKNFLLTIGKNPYFGDAVTQAHDCTELILEFEEKNKLKLISSIN